MRFCYYCFEDTPTKDEDCIICGFSKPNIGEKMKQKAKIDNWGVREWGLGYSYVLIGTISDHPGQERMKSNDHCTSELVSIDFKNRTAETLNTMYELGKPRKNE